MFNKLRLAWKHRREVAAVAKVAEGIKEAPMDPRPFWKIGRWWAGLGLIFGAIGAIVSGEIGITQALSNTELLVAVATVITGVIQMFAGRGQAKTEALIADNTAKTDATMKAVAKLANRSKLC